MPRERADMVLVARGFFESRAKAQEAIAAGLVRVGGEVLRKASARIDSEAEIAAEAPYPFVSRGGVKLDHALSVFGFEVAGKLCLDVGASTGGFTDVLLRRGVRRVYAVDVGHGQLHASIAARSEVVAMDGIDARALTPAMFDAPPDFIVCDVSFISLKLVLPPVLALAATDATLVALIKPQFEAGPRDLKKGILRDDARRDEICRNLADFVTSLGWHVVGAIPSPIEGGDGNREFLIGARRHR
ncbi:MAG TPA: TlyA family RNA methyltransferase [Beijerinckiaceae bacterium]|nr:TlyA family RNA methyltransferase [Beijerinckiaceae bacterium]